jgi:hypothetical protein
MSNQASGRETPRVSEGFGPAQKEWENLYAVLDQGRTFGAVTTVGRLPGHFCMATVGADKPFTVRSRFHHHKTATLHTVRTAESLGVGAFHSAHFCDEGVAFLVNRMPVIVHSGRIGCKGLRADHTVSIFCFHNSIDLQASFTSRRSGCMSGNTQSRWSIFL